MSALLPRLLLVVGVSLAAVGAAGFDEEVEAEAWPLFAAGLAATTLGGILLRRRLRSAAEGGDEAGAVSRSALARALEEIAAAVVALDEEGEALDAGRLCARIDELFRGPCFDLGARNEDYARLLGAAEFARVWEGYAVGERLLARAWSMATDGHLAEAREELAHARRNLERARHEAAPRADSLTPPR